MTTPRRNSAERPPLTPRPAPLHLRIGTPDLGGANVPTQLIRVDLGAGDITAYVPAFRTPQPNVVRVPYGPENFMPHEMNDNGVYVTVPETWCGPYGPVFSTRVIRVTDMQISDERLCFGFYVPPQWSKFQEPTSRLRQ